MANSKRKCRFCKDYREASTMLLVPAGAFCDVEHAIAWDQASRKRQRMKAIQAKDKEERAQKVKVKSEDMRHQAKLTQDVANRLCLLLDRGKPCISCGRPDTGRPRSRNASHYKSRGANSGLRYDLCNLHAGCVNCNLYQSGNIPGYTQGLTERYGSAMVEYLDTAPRLKQWAGPELIQLRKAMLKEIRLIESGAEPSRDWRALTAEEVEAA